MSWDNHEKLMMRAEMGQYGAVYENGVQEVTGSFYKIYCVTATTFAAITGNITGDTFTGVAHPAGTTFYGIFTALTLTSGSVLLYNTPN